MRIQDALDGYLLQLQADGRSKHTTAQAERHVRLMMAWLTATGRSNDVEQIGHADIAGFLASPTATCRHDGGPRKPTSANALRSSLRCFLGFAHAAGYSPTNAARLVRRALCGAPPPKALSEHDQEKLVAALAEARTEAELRDRALFTFLLATGARIGSTLASRIEDLDLDRAELHLRREKGRRERVVYLAEHVVALLREHIAGRSSGPLFEGASGAPLTARHAARRLAIWCERAGIRRVSPHSLRHTFACTVHARTGDLLLTRAAMGHTSIASTLVYVAVSAERLRAALGA